MEYNTSESSGAKNANEEGTYYTARSSEATWARKRGRRYSLRMDFGVSNVHGLREMIAAIPTEFVLRHVEN